MANRNEAKIRFTAETGEFNDAIKKSNNEMSKLKAEMKLNDTQMKATGESVEGLEKKHELLGDQLKASQAKVEALSGKVEAAARNFGEGSDEVTRLERQLANARTEEERIRQAIQQCNDALQSQRDSANESESATKKLTDKIEEQQEELDSLKEKYVDAVLQFGKSSSEAKDLAKEIKSLSGELKDNQTELGKAEKKADDLDRSFDNTGSAAENSTSGFSVMKGALADLASQAIQLAIDKLSEFIGYLADLPEQTRELRQDLATLDTSFAKQGFTAEEATNTWRDLYSVFGEDDRAVEAANLMSKMCDDQSELSDWVTITTGVWGTYQDSLPVEGLAEAAMESAKTGQVTGVLADALNWGAAEGEKFGVAMKANTEENEEFNKAVSEATTAEDFFNLALQNCATEEEREALIRETLNGLYGDAAEKYEEASGAQMDAKTAAADLALAEAELAEKVEPATTAWTNMKTTLITAVTPAIEAVCTGLMNAFNWLQQHPAAMYAVIGVLAVLAVGITAVSVALGVMAISALAANVAFLPIIATVMAVVAAIGIIVAAGVALYMNWDKIKAKAGELKEKLSQSWSNLKEKTSETWNNIKSKTSETWNNLKSNVSSAAENTKAKVSSAWDNVKSKTSSAWSNVKSKTASTWDNVKSKVTSTADAAKNKVSSAWDLVKSKTSSAFDNAKNKVSSTWSSIKSAISNGASNALSTVTNKFNSIKSKISSIMNSARTIVTNAISKIKSAFNFSWSLPKIKLPHFKISGKFSLSPPSAPKFSVSWYKNGGIMMKPTIFGLNGNKLMAGGEAGPEAILPLDRLEGFIANAVENKMGVVNLQALADAVEELASRPIELSINGKQFAYATASATDSVGGIRSTFRNRGLVVD